MVHREVSLPVPLGGSMGAFIAVFKRLNGWMNTLAGIVLFLMMMLTVVDVVLRMFGTALLGTYELVAVSGAIVVGFAVPQTSWGRGHVCVDFLVENRSQAVRNTVFIITRIMGICLFALLSLYLLKKGIHLYKTGEVSLTLHIPYYPAAYGLSFCFFIECFTLIADIFRIFTAENENG
jgi:TRAP-type C4-dicarboxylate transport system permease small subunit